MKFLINSAFAALLILTSVYFTNAQTTNRFEGYNIIVDAMDTQKEAAGACATRYVSPNTQIEIADLDTKTPMRLSNCNGGNFVPVKQINSTRATVQANNVDYKWCFTGEDKSYRVTFKGDQYSPSLTYNWIATPAERDLGFYNVKDFGAKGDGVTDDTTAIRSAIAYVASRNGGRLRFPDGDYLVGSSREYPDFKGITLTSGIIIEGTGSNITNAPLNNVVKRNSTRITLAGTNRNAPPRAIFRIGECTSRVSVRDLELYAQTDYNTYGVEIVGKFTAGQDYFFDHLAITGFERGMYGHALTLDPNDKQPTNNPYGFTNVISQFQADFVKVNNSNFAMNRQAGIVVDIWNSNWAVKGTFFVTPLKSPTARADGIYIYRLGSLLMEDTFAGAPIEPGGGTFVHAEETAQLTIIGSQCEKMNRSLVFGEVPGTGNVGYTFALINNVFDDPIEIKARKTIVSTGNHYGSNTFKMVHPDSRLYSTGDRFCYDGYILGCNTESGPANFQGGKVIFSTGQQAEGSVPGRPTVFGHDVQFNAPVQMPNVNFNELPRQNVGNGSFVYCTNCRRNTAPCQAGGSGAPAMFVNGRWDCM